ncbi:MAG: hypothetical protein ACTHM8_03100 [Sphingomonas sp.]
MFTDRDYPHLRAITALHHLIGGKVELKNPGVITPGWAKVPERKLMFVAGDMEHILDFTKLRPLAIEHKCDIVATYCDQWREGHRFQFDLVLTRAGKTTIFGAYRLWMASGGACFFVPGNGDGPAISAMTLRLSVGKRPPFKKAADRLIGITRGQAELHTRIYGARSAAAIAHDRYAQF